MEKLPKYQHLGMTLVINFDERAVRDDEHDVTRYEYTTAKVSKASSRDERIEAIIKTKYPTYGAELAAVRKDAVAFEAFVQLAKGIADESLA